MVSQLTNAILTALAPVRPTLETFYRLLDDEQKARLVAMSFSHDAQPQARRSAPSRGGAGERQADRGPVCRLWIAMLRSLPVRQIENDFTLSDERRAAMYDMTLLRPPIALLATWLPHVIRKITSHRSAVLTSGKIQLRSVGQGIPIRSGRLLIALKERSRPSRRPGSTRCCISRTHPRMPHIEPALSRAQFPSGRDGRQRGTPILP